MWEYEKNLACRLAQEAGRRIQQNVSQGFEQGLKADGSVVTSVDTDLDAFLTQALLEQFPEDGVLSEESGWTGNSQADRVWLVDPVDGTKAFVLGQSGYAVHIGLLAGGEPVLGVVYNPYDDQLLVGVRGEGAWFSSPMGAGSVRARVSTENTWDRLRVTLSAGLTPDERDRLYESTGWRAGPVCHGTGVKVSHVVRGAAEVYFSHHPLSYWDTLAPAVIAEEAGATVTLLDGSPLHYQLDATWEHPGFLVVSHGRCHPRIMDVLSRWQQG